MGQNATHACNPLIEDPDSNFVTSSNLASYELVASHSLQITESGVRLYQVRLV